MDYTALLIARQEHGELAQGRPVVEGTRVYTAGPLRRGLAHLGGLLMAAGWRLQGTPAGPLGVRPTR